MQLVVIFYQYSDFFHNMSLKANDWVENLCLHQLFCWHQSQIKNTSTCFAFLLLEDNGLSNILLPFCWQIASVFHIALIMLLVLLVCCKTVNLLLSQIDQKECSTWTEKVTYTSHDNTSVFWRFKKMRFWRKPEDMCNQLNSMSWVKLNKVTCKVTY